MRDGRACMKSTYAWVLANLCHWGVSKKSCNAVVRWTSFNRCHTCGMSSLRKRIMNIKYLLVRLDNDLMQTFEMWETSNSTSCPSSKVTGTTCRIEDVEQGRKLLNWNTGCKHELSLAPVIYKCVFPISFSLVNGPSCRLRSLRLCCPCRTRFFVTNGTLPPRTKCRAVDGSKRAACISSLCNNNTVRTRAWMLCNNFDRYVASCETGIEGRVLNNMPRVAHLVSTSIPLHSAYVQGSYLSF
jgi:hypothetical protein